MRYEDVEPIDRNEALAALSSGKPDTICDALLRLSYHDPEWRWVEDECVRLAQHWDANVRRMAATCLGHLVRIYGTLDVERVTKVLIELRRDAAVAGQAQDALDDIDVYIKRSS